MDGASQPLDLLERQEDLLLALAKADPGTSAVTPFHAQRDGNEVVISHPSLPTPLRASAIDVDELRRRKVIRLLGPPGDSFEFVLAPEGVTQSKRIERRSLERASLAGEGPFLIATWFLLTGLFSAVVGAMDLFTAGQLSSRVLGALLAAAGLLLLVAAFGALSKRPWAPSIEILAGLAGAFVGATLITAQWTSGDPDWRIAVWASVAVVSVAVAIFVAHNCGTQLLPELRRVRFLASALSISAILGIVQFWQSSAYAPAAAPGLSITPGLSQLPQTVISGQSFIPIRVAIGIENTSSSKVRVLESLDRLDGIRTESHLDAPTDVSRGFGEALKRPDSTAPILISRFVQGGQRQTLAAGTPLLQDSWFEPGQTYTTTRVVYIPKNRKIALLTLRVDLVVAKRDQLYLHDPSPQPEQLPLAEGKTGVLAERAVQETSVVHWLTRVDRRVFVGAIIDGPKDPVPAPDLYFTDGGAFSDSYDRRLKRDYSVGDDFAFTDLALKR